MVFCTGANSKIKDSLFATVGEKAVANSDIVNEIKTILIINNQPYREDLKKELQSSAVNATIKRLVKKIEISKYQGLTYNAADLDNEINRIAGNLNINVDTLKVRFENEGVSFSTIVDNFRIELLWNSLIFNLYEDKLNVNIDEINEQINLYKDKVNIHEYLISEIVIKPVPSSELKTVIKKIKNKITLDGFEKTALELSISETASRNGDLGWISEDTIAEKFKSKIINTNVGKVSEPIILPEGILFFKVRDKKSVKKNIDINEIKNKLIFNEKNKILNMYSLTHFEKIKRNVVINYY